MVSGVVLKGGTNHLQLTAGGKVYVPGDIVPITAAQMRALEKQHIRFDVPKPEPKADAPPKDKTP